MKKMFFVLLLGGCVLLPKEGFSAISQVDEYENGVNAGKQRAYDLINQYRVTHYYLGVVDIPVSIDLGGFHMIVYQQGFSETEFCRKLSGLPEIKAERESYERRSGESDWYMGVYNGFGFRFDDRPPIPTVPIDDPTHIQP